MGKRDTIRINDFTEPAVNVHWAVGPNSENGQADVKTLQTLFRYLAGYSKSASIGYFGLPRNQMPRISGRFDSATKQAILSFQIKHAKRLLGIDGVIHPAIYDGRNIKAGLGKRYMTITLLHFFARDIQSSYPEPTYIDGLIKLTPELRPWLS